MMVNDAGSVLWRRLLYFLTPQLDIYENVRRAAEGKRVLEVGFGTGVGVLQYCGLAKSVDAVDISPAAVAFARRSLPLQGVRWLEDDFCSPAQPYRTYDLVVMIEVLEHMPEFDRALFQLHAALTSQGVAILTVPNALRYRRRPEPLNVQEWTPAGFVQILKDSGFDDVWLLDSNLHLRYDMDHKESPLVVAVRRGY